MSNKKNIIIFSATQRSGSTLVQRLFNLEDNTMVWGEGGRAFQHLFTGQQAMIRFADSSDEIRDKYFSAENRHEVFLIQNMTPEKTLVSKSFGDAAQHIFDNVYKAASPKGVTRFGFKEVNFSPKVAEFTLKSLENTEGFFLARNPYKAFDSLAKVWDWKPSAFARLWKENVSGYANLGKVYYYEDILGDKETQQELIGKIGVSDDKFYKLLGNKVFSSGKRQKKSINQVRLLRRALEENPIQEYERYRPSNDEFAKFIEGRSPSD